MKEVKIKFFISVLFITAFIGCSTLDKTDQSLTISNNPDTGIKVTAEVGLTKYGSEKKE